MLEKFRANVLNSKPPALLREIFKEPRLNSYKKGKTLRDILVRAKL